MRIRFKYEPPSAIRKLAITITHPYRWRAKVRPWVFDNESGARFQLAGDEDAVVRRLSVRMAKGAPATQLTTAFDHVAQAIVQRRLGYGFEWTRLAKMTDGGWDALLGATGNKH
jgi:hypothetical protein